MCFPGATGDDLEAQNDAPQSSNPTQDPSPRFQWTDALQQNFREELEKLVILDYMMRNTGTSSLLSPANSDRGLDNWMIKICWHNHDNDDAHVNGAGSDTQNRNGKNGDHHSSMTKPVSDQPLQSPALVELRTSDTLTSRTASPQPAAPHIHIGAIDNSLAFPWKHPDEWRSFPL